MKNRKLLIGVFVVIGLGAIAGWVIAELLLTAV